MIKQYLMPDCATCVSRMNSFFSSLSTEQAQQLSINRTCNNYFKGQVLFYEGTQSSGAFCIYKGKVKISSIGIDGLEQIVRLAKEGAVVGYKGLISGEPYTVSATVLEDSSICFIPKNIFLYYTINDPRQTITLLKSLLDELSQKEKMLVSLATKSIRKRVAETLLMLKSFYGTKKDQKTLAGYISRNDFAHIVGTATESVVRVLTDFKNKKYIADSGKLIKILKPKKLTEIANVLD